jgi:hypothetical protein
MTPVRECCLTESKLPNDHLTAVRVQFSPAFVASQPARIFDAVYLFRSVVNPSRTYDVALDGRRFLMIKKAQGPRLVVVVNWAATLHEK